MTPLMQPLRDEHRGLIPHIDALAAAGDAVGTVGVEELRAWSTRPSRSWSTT